MDQEKNGWKVQLFCVDISVHTERGVQVTTEVYVFP